MMNLVRIKEKQVSKNKNNILIYFIVREKSRFIVGLIEDKKKLKEERKRYSSWRSRIESGVVQVGVTHMEILLQMDGLHVKKKMKMMMMKIQIIIKRKIKKKRVVMKNLLVMMMMMMVKTKKVKKTKKAKKIKKKKVMMKMKKKRNQVNLLIQLKLK